MKFVIGNDKLAQVGDVVWISNYTGEVLASPPNYSVSILKCAITGIRGDDSVVLKAVGKDGILYAVPEILFSSEADCWEGLAKKMSLLAGQLAQAQHHFETLELYAWDEEAGARHTEQPTPSSDPDTEIPF